MFQSAFSLLRSRSGLGVVGLGLGLLGCGQRDTSAMLAGPATPRPQVLPPIIGGTLLATSNDHWLVAAPYAELRGGLLATAPFHWSGDLPDMTTLMTQVFTGRMSGPALSGSQVDSIARWLDAQPLLPRPTVTDSDSVVRGRALFSDATVGCASCHSGPRFTNNQNADVGTGGAFQVPSLLGVGMGAPYMHTGCAESLPDRFDIFCGGGDNHGHTSQLSSQDLDDLVAYLKTL